ncbi:MAG TPA: hypothetical protein VGR22_06845 [Thermomicrobiales bacterium]|nr:hypothetical protein [Thermomicrobiales bacterium]
MAERIASRVENLLNRVPGYTGYRQKESMRDDDRRLREQIARELQQSISDLTRIGSKLAASRQLDRISAAEDTVSRLRHLESRVRTASYGYGGIFSDRDVNEHALAQIRQFDVAFQERVAGLTESVSAVASADSFDPSALEGIRREIDTLNTLFDMRTDVIETASPSDDPDVLALLEEPRALSAHERQLLGIRSGGTGAILGDNYQFTSHIALTSPAGEPVATLVQLDRGPEWLAITDDGREVRAWRVTEQEVVTPGASGQPASASISGPQGSTSGVPATYRLSVVGAGQDARAEVKLRAAGSDRAYSGTNVPLLDLQIFSQGG